MGVFVTDINELTAKLKAAAQELGGEEWRYERPCIYGRGYIVNGAGQTVVCTTEGDVSAVCVRFMEVANPANILALTEALEAAQSRIAELEARTLTVKLPDYRGTYKEAFASEVEHHVRSQLEKLAADAGIKLQIEGEWV